MRSCDQLKDSLEELVRLWLCRLFAPTKAWEQMITRRGFADDDVAWALGMQKWVEMGSNFDSHEVRQAFMAMHRDLESRSLTGAASTGERNVAKVGKVLGLDQADRKILLFFGIKENYPVLEDGLNVFRGMQRKDYFRALGRILGVPYKSIQSSLSSGAPLMQSALLKWGRSSRHGHYVSMEMDKIAEKLLEPDFTLEKAIRTIAMPGAAPTLTYRDYPHLAKTLGFLRPCLRETLRSGAKGMNVYIHGHPGTGKSELVRVLAREMRAPLYEISSEDSDGDPQSGARRLEALRAAQSFLAARRSILAVDEAEDVFRGESFFSRSIASLRKGWMNRFFETNPVPTFWLSNSRRGLDPAFVRRFDFIFELNSPPRQQRIRSYRKICRNEVPQKTVEELAECEFLTPAIVARANTVAGKVRNAKPGTPHEEVLVHLVEQTLKAQGHGEDVLQANKSPVPSVFELDYLNSDIPLAQVARKFNKDASCRMCLYGPPGTGKTTFGYWLARKLDLPIHVKRASDILGPFVGQTEENLARIFRQARHDKALLMIDEVDSFLRERRQAHRSWEVTQVNEFLTQMERFEGVFIASTNLVNDLDRASLRRFDMKIAFDYLQAGQVCSLFQRHCSELGLGIPDKGVLEEAGLLMNSTPGDFANVARQHRFRKFVNPEGFLAAVMEECRIKEGGNRKRVGF